MRIKSVVLGGVMVLALCVSVLAAFCANCRKQIPDGQKYCTDCLAAMNLRKPPAAEKEFINDVVLKRNEYENSLEGLRKFYIDTGNAAGKAKADKELEDLRRMRHYIYQPWEDSLPAMMTPTDDIKEAELLYRDGEKLREGLNPIGREARLLEAVEGYRRILEKYQKSNRVADAAYRLGEVYEELGGPDTERAAQFYVRCATWDPNSQFPAIFRAAQIYDQKLHDYKTAAGLYKQAAAQSKDADVRRRATQRLAQLVKEGHIEDDGAAAGKDAR
jgi:hypothetical protein